MIEKFCPFCNLILKKCGVGAHIYNCKSNQSSIDKSEIKFLYIKRNFPDVCNREVLIDLYVDKLNSLPDLNLKFGIDFKSLLFLLKYFNIPTRGISESSTKISNIKYKKTCLDKYGVENVLSKGSVGYNKKVETLKNKYGVDNPFKIDSIKEKIFSDKLWIEKYGLKRKELISKKGKIIWSSLTDEQKNIWLDKSIRSDKCFKKQKIKGYRVSKLETKVQECFNRLLIKYEPQFIIKSGKKYKFYDFIIKDTNIIFEIQGDYWHANPKYYLENSIINYVGGKKTASEVWSNDIEKKEFANLNGYDIIYLWEDEIKNLTVAELENLIIKKIEEYEDFKNKENKKT